MPRRKKTVAAEDLSITWVKETPKTHRRGSRKYLPIVEKLAENPGKPALLVSGLSPGSASSRVGSLRQAAKEQKGTFRFPVRRSVEDGTYSVFGICES